MHTARKLPLDKLGLCCASMVILLRGISSADLLIHIQQCGSNLILNASLIRAQRRQIQ
jgi:hypothetical protein